MPTVEIDGVLVGEGQPCYVVAEAGINHNGDIELARRLIDAAADAGCASVKGQKRTVEVVYTPDELARPRENPFGSTNGDLKRGLELDVAAHHDLDDYARSRGLRWTVSAWDEASVDAAMSWSPPYLKIASASLTDDALLRHHRTYAVPLVLSTGMSTLEQIDHAVDVLGTTDLVLLQCTSTYPTDPEEVNLRSIPALQERYGVPVGYSGHEPGVAISIASVALGACMVERHITLDRSMWGSDQSASIEPTELQALVRGIRDVERALGDGVKRLYDSEIPVRDKLRRIG